ncbi:MAG: type II toxin-antitoxin system RelE family toxin [Candidatus Hodarchaeales archaeon]
MVLSPRASNFLSKADKKLRDRLRAKLLLLQEPFDVDRVKIKGRENSYRTRVGNYRILYSIYQEQELVVVSKIDKRSRVYDR